MDIPALRPHRSPVLPLLLLCALGSLPAAQRNRLRPNDPGSDPYTHGDPELLEAAGIVSLGGFEFGTTDTARMDALLASGDIRWIETEHFEIGMGLAPYKVPLKEKKKIEAELTELAAVLPEVNPETKLLDPWLRAHLFAQRAEKAYDRFLEIMRLQDVRFPSAENPWVIGSPYRGEGPYLGMKGKFEILLVPSKALHLSFLRSHFGLQFPTTQRWHVLDRSTLLVSIHQQQGSLKVDTAMHAHMVFNLAHLMLQGYKHYSYDTPIWLLEGLAHVMGREVSPRYNSFDGSEGSAPLETKKHDWMGEARKLVGKKDQPRIAELVQTRSFGDFEFAHHVVCWSMTKFMIEEHGEGYAGLNDALHGRKTADGYPDGSDMPGAHRTAFREHLGMGYAKFEEAWTEWVKAR